MTAEKAPLFAIELGTQKVRLAPQTIDELIAWLDVQMEHWSNVIAAAPPSGQAVEFLNGLNVSFKALKTARNHAGNAKTAEGEAAAKSLAAAQSAIDQAFNAGRLPLADSVRGKLVGELASDDAFAAKVALYALGAGSPVND